MASGERPPGGPAPIRPGPRVVVELARPARAGEAYRIEAPDRVLRMWFVLNTVAEERQLVTLLPQSRARVRGLVRAVSGELERSVSPALAGELRHLEGWGEAGPEAGQLRVALASLLGWTGGLVLSMLSELVAARDRQRAADLQRPDRTDSGSRGTGIRLARPGVPRRRPHNGLPVGGLGPRHGRGRGRGAHGGPGLPTGRFLGRSGQPLTTPSGTSRAILRHRPPPSAASTTAFTSL
jgi:Protein of unknown function (DUF2587)